MTTFRLFLGNLWKNVAKTRKNFRLEMELEMRSEVNSPVEQTVSYALCGLLSALGKAFKPLTRRGRQMVLIMTAGQTKGPRPHPLRPCETITNNK